MLVHEFSPIGRVRDLGQSQKRVSSFKREANNTIHNHADVALADIRTWAIVPNEHVPCDYVSICWLIRFAGMKKVVLDKGVVAAISITRNGRGINVDLEQVG